MSYFDYAATHPMRDSAVEAWVAASSLLNAGAQYASGRRARSVLDDAREQIAQLLDCEPIEVIFTASGTESNNLAVQGLAAAGETNRIVAAKFEHPAVLETVQALEKRGAEVDWMPVEASGHVVDFTAVDTRADVATLMWANNETGALQNIQEFTQRAAEAGTPVHVDAVQAVGKLPVSFAESGATTLAASGHKFGGPRGVGLLLARRSPAPQPVLFGGGQERGIRPGTVDVAGASAVAAALAEALSEAEEQERRLGRLRDELAGAIRAIPGARINTVEPALASHLHASFDGTDGDSLIMLLDMAGIEASTGSACHAGVNRFSHVLEAMGVEESVGRGSLRFTLGSQTTEEEVRQLAQRLPAIVSQAQGVY